MAYEPTTWNDGDLITAEKMNKLEQGVKNEQVGPQGPKGDPGAQGLKAILELLARPTRSRRLLLRPWAE